MIPAAFLWWLLAKALCLLSWAKAATLWAWSLKWLACALAAVARRERGAA